MQSTYYDPGNRLAAESDLLLMKEGSDNADNRYPSVLTRESATDASQLVPGGSGYRHESSSHVAHPHFCRSPREVQDGNAPTLRATLILTTNQKPDVELQSKVSGAS